MATDETELKVVTVAVRASDGFIFHEGKAEHKQLVRLATPTIGNKWEVIVKQLIKHRRPCKVRLIVGYDESTRTFQYEELTYRPLTPPEKVAIVPMPDRPPPPKRVR